MPRTPARIRLADAARVIRAAQLAGLDKVEFRFDQGATIVVPLKPTTDDDAAPAVNPWDAEDAA